MIDRRRDSGQATVELALCLPVVTIIVLVMTQLCVIGIHTVALVNTTRDVTRAAAIGVDPVMAARQAARRLASDSVQVDVRVDDGWVTVHLTESVPTDLPIVGAWFGDIVIHEELTMLLEPTSG